MTFKSANNLVKEGKLEEAIALYRQTIEKNPSFYNVYDKLGQVLVKLDRLDEGITCYCMAIQLNPKSAWSYYNMGQALTQLSRWDEAIASYQKAIDICPEEDKIKRSCTKAREQVKHLSLAQSLKQQQKLAEATVSYQKAFSLKGGWPKAYFSLGNDLCLLGRYSEAIENYQTAIALKPDFAEAHLHLGNALWQQGKLQAAMESYQQAVTLKPNWAEAYLQLGNALLSLKKCEDASKSYQKAILFKPEIAEAHWQLGTALLALGKREAGIESYQQAVALKPDWANARYHLGNSLLAIGKQEQALHHYEQAVALAPKWAEAFYQLGTALLAIGKKEAAIENYQQAVVLKPDWAEAPYNLANALFQLGKKEAAIENYEKAIALKPDWADAYYQLGNALWALGKVNDAISMYSKAVSIQPEIALTIGATLKERGNFDEAIVIHQQAIAINPELKANYLQLCQLFIQKNNLKKAREFYEILVKIECKSLAVQALCQVSDAFRRNNDMEASISCCQYLLAKRPSCLAAYEQLRQTFLMQGKIEEANHTYSQINQVKFTNIRSQGKIGPVCLFTLIKSGTMYTSNSLIEGLSIKNAPSHWEAIYNELGQNLVRDSFARYSNENFLFSAHASATPTNKLILSCFTHKVLVNIRDIRQACLSITHYFNNLRKTSPGFIFNYSFPENYFYFSLTEQIDWQIENWFMPKAIKWIEEWLDAEEDSSFYPQILFTKYEDLVTNQTQFFNNILDFYEIDKSLFKMPEKPVFQDGSHYRKGAIDEWRSVFTPEQSEKASSLIPRRLFERFGWPEI